MFQEIFSQPETAFPVDQCHQHCTRRLPHSFAKLHGDEAGDAGFAHGNADQLVAGLHGAFAVGDDDELGLPRHFAQERA